MNDDTRAYKAYTEMVGLASVSSGFFEETLRAAHITPPKKAEGGFVIGLEAKGYSTTKITEDGFVSFSLTDKGAARMRAYADRRAEMIKDKSVSLEKMIQTWMTMPYIEDDG